MFCMTFDCYHLNQARTRTLFVLADPGPTLGPGRAEVCGSGPGPCRPLYEYIDMLKFASRDKDVK
jgi:hypothetical protein